MVPELNCTQQYFSVHGFIKILYHTGNVEEHLQNDPTKIPFQYPLPVR
jgi:hypothetical protein